MRLTFLLVGVAAAAAFLTDDAHAQQRQVQQRTIIVDRASAGDVDVYRNDADRAPAEGDYRGRWQGEWQGQWQDAEGRTYNGSYEGSYDARGGETRRHHRSRHDDRRVRSDSRVGWSEADWARHCRRDNGVGGAAIGAVVGGVAGNRIAGRGNRTAGTLIGGGVGALAGLAIDRAEDGRGCEGYWQAHGRDSRRVVRRYSRGGAPYVNGAGYDYGYSSGASYDYSGYEGSSYAYGSEVVGYAPGASQTIVIPGQPVIIEETETFYETVTTPAVVTRARVAPRRPAHRPRPRVRARCTCR